MELLQLVMVSIKFCVLHLYHIKCILVTSYVAITCIDLSAPANGRIDYSPETTSPYGFGTTAIYVCESGFGVNVLQPRICSGDDSSTIGVWSGIAPTCTGMFQSSFVLLHSVISANTILQRST